MNTNQQSAIAALNSVRPIAERLDRARDGEDRAADILELWEGTETSLRALMGGSSLGGQALIRELRQRELISLGQAYSLLEFLGARDRANRTTYKSTPGDVEAARDGFRQLDTGLRQGGTIGESSTPATAPAGTSNTVTKNYGSPAVAGSAGANAAIPSVATTAATPSSRWAPLMHGKNRWLIPGIAGVLLLAVILYATLGRANPDAAMSKGVDFMKDGRREAARTEFATVVRDHPDMASPHIFLARLSREEGDLGTARAEAEKAIRLEPANGIALREMGLVLFATREYDLARNFFIRSLKANPSDLASQGYLGCSLMRLGRDAEANRFLSRAGPGIWTACVQAPAEPPPLTP